jgi:hypothetical protein
MEAFLFEDKNIAVRVNFTSLFIEINRVSPQKELMGCP